ncbi:MAG: SLBB domain-containing protein [Sedimentisphaerales bacterium]|nr:SLBB domain-containing protein [Sedimentisphaerales bacterium]
MRQETMQRLSDVERKSYYLRQDINNSSRSQGNIILGALFWLIVILASMIYGWCYREHWLTTTVKMPQPLLVYVLCWGGLAFNTMLFRWLCRFWWLTLGGMALLLLATGCSFLQPSTPEQLAAFCQAGKVTSQNNAVDVMSEQAAGPYRLVAGDLLEVHLPGLMTESGTTAVSQETPKTVMHLCRIDESGLIKLPLAGEVAAAGKTLKETELRIEQAVYPRYFRHRPTIVVTVRSYYTQNVTVMGGVMRSGVYELHHDEMTLVGAVSRAGGFTPEGASSIRVRRAGENNAEEIINVSFNDGETSIPAITLQGGDIVEVEPAQLRRVTVVGLVQRPGVFSWRVDQAYNVMQALADAGGVDMIAAPEYVSIYRTNPDGEHIEAVVRMNEDGPASLAAIALQTGDVVCVEQTLTTQVRQFLNSVFHVVAGVDMRTQYR